MATERQLALTLLGLLLLVQVELAASSSSGQDPVRVIAWDSQILPESVAACVRCLHSSTDAPHMAKSAGATAAFCYSADGSKDPAAQHHENVCARKSVLTSCPGSNESRPIQHICDCSDFMHNPAFAASVKAQLGADLAVHVEEECVSNATLFLEVGNTVTADTDKGVAPALVVEDCPDILWKLAKDVFEEPRCNPEVRFSAGIGDSMAMRGDECSVSKKAFCEGQKILTATGEYVNPEKAEQNEKTILALANAVSHPCMDSVRVCASLCVKGVCPPPDCSDPDVLERVHGIKRKTIKKALDKINAEFYCAKDVAGISAQQNSILKKMSNGTKDFRAIETGRSKETHDALKKLDEESNVEGNETGSEKTKCTREMRAKLPECEAEKEKKSKAGTGTAVSKECQPVLEHCAGCHETLKGTVKICMNLRDKGSLDNACIAKLNTMCSSGVCYPETKEVRESKLKQKTDPPTLPTKEDESAGGPDFYNPFCGTPPKDGSVMWIPGDPTQNNSPKLELIVDAKSPRMACLGCLSPACEEGGKLKFCNGPTGFIPAKKMAPKASGLVGRKGLFGKSKWGKKVTTEEGKEALNITEVAEPAPADGKVDDNAAAPQANNEPAAEPAKGKTGDRR